MKIAMFGTFDVGNFGDLLFPIVAEIKLGRLVDVELTRYSYRRLSDQEWCYDVSPIQDFPSNAWEYDLVLVGGGHLVHFNPLMSVGYVPTDQSIPHPLGFWWLPTLFGQISGLPVVLHGISTDPEFPRWADPLMKAFVESLDYATVRDVYSQARLNEFAGPSQEIEVVPDSVFSIADIITRDEHSSAFEDFADKIGLKGKYIIIQPSYTLRVHKTEIISLAKAAVARGWSVLELPIGFGIGNDIGYYPEFDGLRRISEWPAPLLLAEIIANAEAVAGVSLHLSIVASSFGIPVFRPAIRKGSKFELLRELPNVQFLGHGAALVGRSDKEPNLERVEDLRRRLDRHWQRIVDVAVRPKTAVRERAWAQLCATPAHFRQSRTIAERSRDSVTEAARMRQLVTHRVRQRFLP